REAGAVDEEEAITILITQAVASPEGRLRLATAEEHIIEELERNRFNTERAVEVYSFAIDYSVWAWVKDMPLGKLMYRDYLRSGWEKSSQLNALRNLRTVAAVLRLLRTSGRLGDFCAPC